MAYIKIKHRDRRSSLGMAAILSIAVLVWLGSWLWSRHPDTSAQRRPLSVIRSWYQCDSGHLFEDVLDTQSKPCSMSGCDSRAWPVASVQCSRHGRMICQLRYTLDADQCPVIKAVRPAGKSWQPVADRLVCPDCDRSLVPDLSFRN